ncbi:hypothetical protein H2198_002241 [Neophaeococcomyces mojaviensis]|uniref:Uncharacterized protein n=1 Tax=Neophaeococcomyces mojaviensis TaxID=3383035 RepID=A0ACC3AEL7_9EURO|nr:hypothetical protein H2198_002241 [Knufia sp. JES_112]
MASTDFLTAANDAAQSSLNLPNLTHTAVNTTGSLINSLSAKDAVLFPLRLLAKADHFLFSTFPRAVLRTTGLGALINGAIDHFRERNMAEVGGVAAAAGVAQAVDPAAGSWSDFLAEAFQQSTNRSYWGMLHYMTSRWAFTCFMLALVLNRVGVYGASRQRIVLTWNKRLALRLVPIMLFIAQIHQLLRAIHCQSSPYYSLYRHGDNDKYTILDWSTDGGVVHKVSSSLLFWSTDEQSCAALGMSRPEPNVRARYGSFSLLWPTFLKLSLSHLVENLSCSLQQIPVMTEVGLSVFEHSLAFAEAETMIAHTLDKSIGKAIRAANVTSSTVTAAAAVATEEASIPASGTLLAITDAAQAVVGPHLFDKFNVPVEVLLVALISCGNSLASHVISVLGKKHKWRLANTAFWGFCYITAFTWGFLSESNLVRNDGTGTRPVSGLLHFPTVAIVGFLPHIAIIFGILICGVIYAVALLLTAVSLGTNPNIRQPSSLGERISIAHDNLQAAIQVKSINIRWYEDFYTALLRVGFAALTAASEAVFLNEGRSVEMRQFTWLEEERLDELDDSLDPLRSPEEAHFQIVEEYGIPGTTRDGHSRQVGEWQSGYEKEKKLDKKDKTLQAKDAFIYPNPRTDGVGALQRTTRFYLLFIFMRGIMFTVAGWLAYGIGAFLDRIGITARPAWLRRIIGGSLKQSANDRDRLRTYEENKRFDEWAKTHPQQNRARNFDVDISHEIRQKLVGEDIDEQLDDQMYNHFKSGGWYGNRDDSGDFILPSVEQDEDVTSIITTTTASSEADEQGWESESDGRRTPTQRQKSPSWSFGDILRYRRSETPTPEAPILDNATLARLLNPQDKASRDEARVLSSHLTSDSVMTRSRYRRQFEADRASVLLAGRTQPTTNIANTSTSSTARQPLTDEEEAQTLEHLLLTRRKQKSSAKFQSQRQRSPNVDDSEPQLPQQTGPPCVVCQAEPRTIITWPCRCLTVCEDCRVNLAMNNFGKCVTCRRDVGGFVRLYVP